MMMMSEQLQVKEFDVQVEMSTSKLKILKRCRTKHHSYHSHSYRRTNWKPLNLAAGLLYTAPQQTVLRSIPLLIRSHGFKPRSALTHRGLWHAVHT